MSSPGGIDRGAQGEASMSADRPSPKTEARKAREARLAAELRENLRKRKAQGRARKDAGPKPATEDR
jgi:hypothetical protein